MFHSYIITGSTQEKRQQYIDDFVKRLKISAYDLFSLDISPVTIAQIRQVKQFLSLRPLASTHKAVILQTENITPEAQQAILKTLEEPPKHSLIFISSHNENSLLPTIISRCSIIKIHDEKIRTLTYDTAVCQQFWQKIFSISKGERLTQTSVITTDRNETLTWTVTQIEYFRNELINAYFHPDKKIFPAISAFFILRQLQKTYGYLQGNISLKLAIDNLFLNI